ncbi:hypothetical protein AVEN_74053-1, partial [Araneus ventricosus]
MSHFSINKTSNMFIIIPHPRPVAIKAVISINPSSDAVFAPASSGSMRLTPQ